MHTLVEKVSSALLRYVMMHTNTLLTQVAPCRDHKCAPTARNRTFGSPTSRCMCAAIYPQQTDH